MPQKLEVTTASVASAAASSPVWLPKAEDSLSIVAHPVWADLLAPLGVFWLVVQIGFYLYEKWKKHCDTDEQE